jgi:hypothetical protein
LTALAADEAVVPRHQGAHDLRRYDVCKDVKRIAMPSARGMALLFSF